MLAMMETPVIYSGRFRADGHIIDVTPELLALHQRCGGGRSDPLALPGLPSLLRRAASLKMPLSASVLMADGPRNVTYWARALPREDCVELQLFDWNDGCAELPHALQNTVRERDFLRASSDWLWELDANLRFVTLSESATAALGQPAVLVVSKHIAEVLRPVASGAGGEAGFRSGSDPTDWFNDLVVETLGTGKTRFFHMTGRPVYDGDRLTGLRGTAVETVQPAPPPVAKADTMPEQMPDEAAALPVTDMLRDPIEQITRRAEAMHAQSFGHLRSVYAGYAGDILTAARHLRTLIDDVFDVAAIDSGTVSLSMEKVDLTTLAEEARAIVSQRAAASGSRILWRSPPASVIVHADWGRTLQTLINLMQNAVKFAGTAGPIQLSLEIGNTHVRLCVDDQGPGITEADRERVFSKFERLQPHAAEGSGLGLYISHALARAMGGDIELSESPEGGARFALVLARA